MLKNRYLKYNPDITFEVFEKICMKLYDNNWRRLADISMVAEYEFFSDNYNILKEGNDHKLFGAYTEVSPDSTEITVEELLSINKKDKAVHCKTQEEWDFVLSKLPISCLLSKQSNKFVEYNTDYKHENGIAVDVEDCAYCGIGWYKNKGYQILSFQEWCDLNGYKMENKVKFEIGKWYKLGIKNKPSNYLLKCSKLNGKSFYYSQYIILDKSKLVDSVISSGLYSIDLIGDVVSIEEIQQYLPDGHPDKIKSNDFKVGDYIILEDAGGWSYSPCNNGCLGIIREIGNYRPSIVDKYICSITGDILNSKNKDKTFKDIPIAFYQGKLIVRHATPEEINNHLIFIGQIPAGEPLNNGIEPNKDGIYQVDKKHQEDLIRQGIKIRDEFFKSGNTQSPPKMILSIDDEELPMVNIIKVKSVKVLNID